MSPFSFLLYIEHFSILRLTLSIRKSTTHSVYQYLCPRWSGMQGRHYFLFDCYCFKREDTVSSPKGGVWIKGLFKTLPTYLFTVPLAFFDVFNIAKESKTYSWKRKEKDHNSSQVFKNQTSIFLAVWSQLTFHFLRDLPWPPKENTCLEQTFRDLTHFCWTLGNTWNCHLLFICLHVSFCSCLPHHSAGSWEWHATVMKAPCPLLILNAYTVPAHSRRTQSCRVSGKPHSGSPERARGYTQLAVHPQSRL